MMKKKIVAFISILICALLAFQIIYVNAEYKESDIQKAISDAVEWKEKNDSPLGSIGSYSSDMYIMALRRIGSKYDYGAYLAGLENIIISYGEQDNASVMQRTALATIAAGGDPCNTAGRDMIADGVYFRNNVSPIDKEGVNGYIWGLIALDSKGYQLPDWALTNRNDLIVGMLSHQNTDGSFDGSVYSTASAIIALSPYYENTGAYTITQNQTGATLDLSPADAVNLAIDYLANAQNVYGDFGDVQSTAMTILALDAIGLDADTDRRFIAQKGSALDGLMIYRKKDGGFSNNLKKSDGEATSLALCALTGYLRTVQGCAPFFSFATEDAVSLSTKTTAKPSSTQRPQSTARPTVSKAPKSTSRPAVTMRPTKTTTPQSEATNLPTSTSTPKPTKRPAMVGPVEMPGPMPSYTPEPLEGGNTDGRSNIGAAAVIIMIIILVLAALALLMLLLMKKDKLHMPETLSKLLMKEKRENKGNKAYRAKSHKKTDKRRKFDNHAKFRQRRKFNNRMKFK